MGAGGGRVFALARWPFSPQLQQMISSSGVLGPLESFAGDFKDPVGTCVNFRVVAAAAAAGAEDLFAPVAATAAPALFFLFPSSELTAPVALIFLNAL